MSVKKLISAVALAAAVIVPVVGASHAGSSAPRLRADFGWDVIVSNPPVK